MYSFSFSFFPYGFLVFKHGFAFLFLPLKPACLCIAWGVCLFCFFIFPRLNLETRGSAQVDGEHILQCEKAIITWGLGLIFFHLFSFIF